MKGKMFSNLNEQEKRAKFLSMLVKKSEGKLSEQELLRIVNSINIDIQFNIKVVNDAKVFAKELKLRSHKKIRNCINNFVRSEGINETLRDILIDNEISMYGTDIEVDVSTTMNDNEIEPYHISIDPVFDISKKGCFIKKIRTWRKFSQKDDFDVTKYLLVLYIPSEEPYVIDDKIKYIMTNFNLQGVANYE